VRSHMENPRARFVHRLARVEVERVLSGVLKRLVVSELLFQLPQVGKVFVCAGLQGACHG